MSQGLSTHHAVEGESNSQDRGNVSNDVVAPETAEATDDRVAQAKDDRINEGRVEQQETVTRTVVLTRTVTVVPPSPTPRVRTVVLTRTVRVVPPSPTPREVIRTVVQTREIIRTVVQTREVIRTVVVTVGDASGGGGGGLFLGFGGGAIFAGGIGWLAFRRSSRDRESDAPRESGGEADVAPGRGASGTTAGSEDSDPLTRVNEYVDEGDDRLRRAAEQRESRRYDAAIEAYESAREAYEKAHGIAERNDFIDEEGIREKLDQTEEGIRSTRRERIEETLSSIRTEFERSKGLVEDGEYERARDELEDLRERLAAVEGASEERGFEGLHDEAIALREQLTGELESVTRLIEAEPGPPDVIPRGPDLSVEYDAITKGDRIGRGGDADVFESTVETADGPVTIALKEPRFSGTLHSEVIDRFLDEAETWDRLDDHDHIVGVIDWGSDPIPWIALEYMDGGDLSEYVGSMGIEQATWTALGITEGVLHAHDFGITHLDIKPENILFRKTEEDAWDVPKVGDWGLAKLLIEHSKSMEGLTPQYSAPEQFDTDEYGTVDKRTDIYQLGAVLYELYTGEPVFSGQPAQIMHKVTSEDPTPPTEIDPDLPGKLDDILLRALEKRKHDRYERVPYLRDALRELDDSL